MTGIVADARMKNSQKNGLSEISSEVADGTVLNIALIAITKINAKTKSQPIRLKPYHSK